MACCRKSDITQLADAPLTDAKKAEWGYLIGRLYAICRLTNASATTYEERLPGRRSLFRVIHIPVILKSSIKFLRGVQLAPSSTFILACFLLLASTAHTLDMMAVEVTGAADPFLVSSVNFVHLAKLYTAFP